MNNLRGIKFIGDLSLQDAAILVKYARKSRSLLEFGVGGSTQILAQCTEASRIVSIDTDENWINITKSRLSQCLVKTPVDFYTYNKKNSALSGKTFDFVFVDGVDSLRKEFALESWSLLQVGGVILFHDTRREKDFGIVTDLLNKWYNEVSLVEVNAEAESGISSNITVIHKKEYVPYVNWNLSEGKDMWAYGAVMDESIPLWEFK